MITPRCAKRIIAGAARVSRSGRGRQWTPGNRPSARAPNFRSFTYSGSRSTRERRVTIPSSRRGPRRFSTKGVDTPRLIDHQMSSISSRRLDGGDAADVSDRSGSPWRSRSSKLGRAEQLPNRSALRESSAVVVIGKAIGTHPRKRRMFLHSGLNSDKSEWSRPQPPIVCTPGHRPRKLSSLWDGHSSCSSGHEPTKGLRAARKQSGGCDWRDADRHAAWPHLRDRARPG